MKVNFKSVKGYVIGGLIGATLMFSVQGFAEDGLQTISALLRTGLNVTLDGKSVTLDNPSINYNGSTYVKLRDITKVTGTGVYWNDTTQTIELTSVTGAVYGGTSVSGSVYGDTSTSTEVTGTPSPTPTPTPLDSNGLILGINKITKDNVDYVYVMDIDGVNPYYYISYVRSSNQLNLMYSKTGNKDKHLDDEIAVFNIPYIVLNGKTAIEYLYFSQNISPLLKTN